MHAQSMQSGTGRLSCSRTALKRCTSTETRYYYYYYYYYRRHHYHHHHLYCFYYIHCYFDVHLVQHMQGSDAESGCYVRMTIMIPGTADDGAL